METDPVSKTLYFLVSRILDDGQVQKPVILSGMKLQVIRSQTREFANAPAKHFSHCCFKVDSAQTRIRKQLWGYS
jgi:hypothetical protein